MTTQFASVGAPHEIHQALQNISKETCTHLPGDLAAFVAFDQKTRVREEEAIPHSHGVCLCEVG